MMFIEWAFITNIVKRRLSVPDEELIETLLIETFSATNFTKLIYTKITIYEFKDII